MALTILGLLFIGPSPSWGAQEDHRLLDLQVVDYKNRPVPSLKVTASSTSSTNETFSSSATTGPSGQVRLRAFLGEVRFFVTGAGFRQTRPIIQQFTEQTSSFSILVPTKEVVANLKFVSSSGLPIMGVTGRLLGPFLDPSLSRDFFVEQIWSEVSSSQGIMQLSWWAPGMWTNPNGFVATYSFRPYVGTSVSKMMTLGELINSEIKLPALVEMRISAPATVARKTGKILFSASIVAPNDALQSGEFSSRFPQINLLMRKSSKLSTDRDWQLVSRIKLATNGSVRFSYPTKGLLGTYQFQLRGSGFDAGSQTRVVTIK